MPKIRKFLPVAALAAFAAASTSGLVAQPAQAQDVTLRAATTLPEQDLLSIGYHIFAEKLAEVSGGEIATRYIGGPETINPFEIGAATRRGVTDIAITPAAYYADEVPQGLALSYSELSTQEEIEAGAIDYLNEKHNQGMGVELLGRMSEVEFAFFTKEPVESIEDFEGLRLRGTPTYRPFIDALGAQMVAMPGGEIYTALERGVVDGFGWGHIGIAHMGLQEQAKTRVTPFFFRMDVVMIMNADTWSGLNEEQQEMVREAVRLTQEELPAATEAYGEREAEAYAEAGLEDVTLGDDFRALAYEAAWSWVEENLSADADDLKIYFRKQ